MQTTNFYWLRQPLLSIERLLAVLAEGRLADLVEEETVAEAIRIAAPAISEQLKGGFLTNSKLAETALKYVLRMSTRCTPFGLFAGGTVGHLGATSNLNFKNRQIIAHHRLDMQILIDLAYELSSQPVIKNKLRFYTNQSVHYIGNRLRYTESHWESGHWNYFSSEVPADHHIMTVINLANSGALISELAKAIATDENRTQAYDFINRLIEDGLLQSELQPAPTGPDPLTHLIKTLGAWSSPPPVHSNLIKIQTLLAQSKGMLQPKRLIQSILTEQIGLPVRNDAVLQTDLQVVEPSNQLSQNVFNQLQRRLAALHVLSRFNPENNDTQTFKQRFYARYQDQEVPLLVALDEDIGVGYGESLKTSDSTQGLIDDLLTQPSTVPTTTFSVDALHDLRLRLYSNWSLQKDTYAEITDQDLARLGPPTGPMPDSSYAFGYFLAPSTSAIDAGHYNFYLKALSGPSAFTLLGRFCTIDAQLNDLVTAHLAQQQREQPDRLYAEVVHLPQARTGNVVQRPHLQPYEIPYLTPSNVPFDYQLSPQDLMISVPKGKRVVLRSKRLGKEIIPQLTTAHTYRDGLPIYRFLCDLQHQDVSLSVNWHWGALAEARRLPRVQYQNIILQEAAWSFTVSDLKPELSDEKNVQWLQQQQQLPRLVALQQGDQELFLDLTSPACCQLFVSTLRRVERVRVIEWLRTPDNCPVIGPEGKLTHEVVIPFVHPAKPLFKQPLSATSTANPVFKSQRNFPPGSDWLYLKIYCGPSTMAAVLKQTTQVAQQAVSTGQITHWFFIRYNDPESHLRIRLRLTDKDQYGSMVATYQKAFAEALLSGEIHRYQLDTYEREIERYGDATIDPTERIFWHDSELVSQLLGMDMPETSMLTMAIMGIDAYQTSFGLTLTEKRAVCEQIFSDLFNEHGATTGLRQTLAQKYRLNQSLVLKVLRQETSPEMVPIYPLFQHHVEAIRPFVTAIRQENIDSKPVQWWQYISSLGHLYINRLFSTNQRTYELLIYHHLLRAYQALNSRQAP